MNTPMDNFMKAKAAFDARLQQLQDLSDEHFGADAEAVTWGDVASLSEANDLLRRVLAHFNAKV